MLKLYEFRVVDLSKEGLEECRRLSYGDEGYMCDDLDDILETENHNRVRYRYSMAVLLMDDKELIGWALLQPIYCSPRYTAQLFVDPEYRKRGYGTKLLRYCNQWTNRKVVIYSDEDNEEFFMKNANLCTEV